MLRLAFCLFILRSLGPLQPVNPPRPHTSSLPCLAPVLSQPPSSSLSPCRSFPHTNQLDRHRAMSGGCRPVVQPRPVPTKDLSVIPMSPPLSRPSLLAIPIFSPRALPSLLFCPSSRCLPFPPLSPFAPFGSLPLPTRLPRCLPTPSFHHLSLPLCGFLPRPLLSLESSFLVSSHCTTCPSSPALLAAKRRLLHLCPSNPLLSPARGYAARHHCAPCVHFWRIGPSLCVFGPPHSRRFPRTTPSFRCHGRAKGSPARPSLGAPRSPSTPQVQRVLRALPGQSPSFCPPFSLLPLPSWLAF
ncbi:hypothetical protein, conserved in T. vivax [Trypanosoma vivax Y486]|uniref:Uncharacterized protein n=1 Tax=Trypanosoma vivax (strain Y486) TaxID=1055687 RepID=F9WLN6_TRYVY|nr:hypothetical protein, conserved in T. vivax [Trypanosoma vivax Y486]|eukprot:CCD18428.1 hypothetical protein, conserved in T. vivax [Trypanosoma vivax Y486]